MKQKFTAVLIIILFSFFKLNTVKAQVNVQDSLALVDLYNSTNGPGWRRHDGWLTKSPVSTWYRVTVTSNRVTQLYLNGNLLTGSIPLSIGNLSNLGGLDLDFNNLSGTIPTSFSKLIKMYYLNLNDNHLTGNISFLAKLTNPQDIELADNELSGKIPAINCANLHDILLSNNKLSGSVPKFGKDTASQSDVAIDLHNNNLSGSINHQFDSVIHLAYLFLNNNQLTGKIPASLNKLIDLSALDLSYNQLSGKIPSLDSLNKLFSLNLQNNKFTFGGMEDIATTFPFAVYSPQANISVKQNGDILSVSAGGIVSNNTYNWYKNGVLFKTKSGNAYLTIKSNGNYSVDVTNAVATTLTLHSDTINYIMFTSLSNEQVNNQNKILKPQVYPNPAKNFTTLSFNADGKYTITIADISCKILQTKTSVTTKGINTIQLDLSKYASGIYLVAITDEKNRKQTVRLSKE